MAAEQRLMAVRAELVREHLVGQLLADALERMEQPLPEGVERALGRAAELLDPAGGPGAAAVRAAASAARAGYGARVAELARFEPARGPISWLAGDLATGAGEREDRWERLAGLSLRLASREPLDRPDPADPDAVTWRVPGPGGHVRHYLAAEVAARLGPPRTGAPADLPLKRPFVYGFLLRCCEDELARGAARQDPRLREAEPGP